MEDELSALFFEDTEDDSIQGTDESTDDAMSEPPPAEWSCEAFGRVSVQPTLL